MYSPILQFRSWRIAWLAAWLLLSPKCFADIFRFLGQNDKNWGNAASWEFAIAPPANGGNGLSDVFVRGPGGTARFDDFFNDPLEWNIRSLTFESQATGGWNHTGGPLHVGTITNNDSNTHSFGNDHILLTGLSNFIIASSGNLDFNTEVFLAHDNGDLEVDGGQSVFFDGGFAGPVSLSRELTVRGGTFVRLGASAETFGTIQIASGTLQANASDVFDSGTDMLVSFMSVLDLNGFNSDIDRLTGSGSVTLGAGTLTLGDFLDFTFSGVVSGSGGLTKNQSGVLTLADSNTYTGATHITSGTLRLENSITDGGLSNATDVNVSSGATFDVNGVIDTVDSIAGAGTILLGGGMLSVNETSGTRTYSGNVQGPGELQKSGGGTLVLSGNNAFTLLDMNSGVLQVSSQGNLGSGTIELSGGEIQVTASFTNARPINANGSGAFNVDANDTLTQTGVISGTGSLAKNGNGVLLLSAANTYTGDTHVNDGTLQLAAAGRIANSSDVVLATGGTLSLNGFDETVNSVSGAGGTISMAAGDLTVAATSGSFTYGGAITGTGGLNKQGAHTLILSAANTYTGVTNITGGTLQYSGAGSLSSSTDVAITTPGVWNLAGISDTVDSISGNGSITLGGATLNVAQAAGNHTFSGTISGAGGGLVKSGMHTLVLSGTNSYTGTTTLDAGILAVTSSSNLGTGSLIFDSGTLATFGTFTSSRPSAINASNSATFNVLAGTTLTHAAPITGNATTSLIKQGTGTLRWNGSAGTPFLGAMQINEGTLDIGVNAAQTLVIPGAISGAAGSLTKSDPGILALFAVNTYGGDTNIAGGTLLLGSPNGRLPTGTDIFISAGAAFDLNGVSGVVNSVSGAGAITLGGGSLTVEENSGTRTFSGAISEPGNLTKNGGHTWVLTGANTFTGNITLNAGVLSVATNANLGNTANDIFLNTATLQATNSFSAARDVTLSTSGSTIDVATGATLDVSGLVRGPGSLTKQGAGTLTLTAASSYAGSTIINGGLLRLQGAGRLPNVSRVEVNVAGTMTEPRGLDLNNISDAINGLDGNGEVKLGSATLTIGSVGGNGNFSGVINGTGDLLKEGTGIQTLSGRNTYSGATFVDRGELILNGGGRIDQLTTVVGFNIGSNGTATADGVGTTWELSGNLQVGRDGTGRMNIRNGATMSVDGAVLIGTTNQGAASAGTLSLAGGTLDNSLGSGIEVVNGSLQGHGTLVGSVDNFATIAPGNAVGILNVTGNFEQASSGVLAFEIGGRDNSNPQAPQFDKLNIMGNVALDGLLRVSLLNGFNPVPGDNFSIVGTGSLAGGFSNVANGGRVNLTSGGTGSFRVNYGAGSPFGANQIVLTDFLGTETNSGDFNSDGLFNCTDIDSLLVQIVAGTNKVTFDLTGDRLVNQADLVQWRTVAGRINLPSGNPYRPGDGNLDGVVDSIDFGIWNRHKFTSIAAWCSGDYSADGVVDGSDFGIWNANTFTSSSSSASVPEPPASVMAMAVAVIILSFRVRPSSRPTCTESVK